MQSAESWQAGGDDSIRRVLRRASTSSRRGNVEKSKRPNSQRLNAHIQFPVVSRLAGGYDGRMTTGANIREKLAREPFQPFRVRVTSGHTYVVRNPTLVVVMRSELFIAHPNSDRHAFIPLLHVAAVETLGNGRTKRPSRRRKKT